MSNEDPSEPPASAPAPDALSSPRTSLNISESDDAAAGPDLRTRPSTLGAKVLAGRLPMRAGCFASWSGRAAKQAAVRDGMSQRSQGIRFTFSVLLG
ncbi:hypothetical protein OOZ51_18720 [Arthrobacter sp. MI7-26]|uniref:hypothetical protein n=1 Tax=Arthrobacter sp. MI7-26 TaxID=2993653 RepID=UPI0022489C4E|nr:hypothetical protein [Arthrobacter sp. MI7-26]MCX2749826.1 hypothetical protein [Arthrobacter sp. MI7-26]